MKERCKCSSITSVQRPDKLNGATYRCATPYGTLFVTINEISDGDGAEPFEVFINVGKCGSDVSTVSEAIGRLISYCLRLASPVSRKERLKEIALQLHGIGGWQNGDGEVRSLPDAIAKVLAKHLQINPNPLPQSDESVHTAAAERQAKPSGNICPICGNASLVRQGSCQKCRLCGYGECS